METTLNNEVRMYTENGVCVDVALTLVAQDYGSVLWDANVAYLVVSNLIVATIDYKAGLFI